jgi:hypothetical protein
MKLDVRALAVTMGLIWGGAILVVGLANLIWHSYGTDFLRVVSSIYPGYHASGSFGDVLSGTIYALVDGAVGGLILGWLYNRIAGTRTV